MQERNKRYKSKGGRLNQRSQIDLGMLPGKKAQAPDPDKLPEEIRDLMSHYKKADEDVMRRKPHMRSSRRSH